MRFPLLSRIFLGLSALLVVIALFVRVLFSSWDVTGIFYLSSGIVCLALSIVLNLEGYYQALQPRSVRRGMQAVGIIFIILSGIVGLNYLASFYPKKIDWSSNQSHTLSHFSKSIAKSFADEVEFLYLQIPGPESKYVDDPVRQAVQKYQDENPQFKFTKLNIMNNPELVDKFNLNSQEQALFVTYKGRRERFYKTDENSITQALLRLLKGRKNIYFSVGHGESAADNQNARGLSNLKKEVERLFYDVVEINLNNEIIPKDAASLVIIGPEKNFNERVKAKILEYLDAGGRVFLAFDPIQNPDNDQFLKNFGLKIPMGVLHQEENILAGSGSHVLSGQAAEAVMHPVLSDLSKDSPVMYYVSGALVLTEPTNYKITPLMTTVPTALLRAGYTKQDKVLGKGTYNILVSATNANKGEIFIAADSDLFANQFLYQHSNSGLMFNLFSYLSKDEDIIKSKSPVSSAKDFLVTDVRYKLYAGFFMFPLPILLFSFGGFLWFRRRWL